MTTYKIIAQIIGIIAMAFNILSYQGKKQSTIITFQLFGGLLFAINFLMLGAIVGGLLNIIAVIRAVVFLYKDKLKADKLPWFIAFFALYVSVYVLNFTVLGQEPTTLNLFIELLPVIGMTALHIGFMLKDASDIRKCALVSSPSWLVYNIVNGSVGAIICETLALVSIFIAMFRHDKKKN